jgi:hypothetical protein
VDNKESDYGEKLQYGKNGAGIFKIFPGSIGKRFLSYLQQHLLERES